MGKKKKYGKWRVKKKKGGKSQQNNPPKKGRELGGKPVSPNDSAQPSPERHSPPALPSLFSRRAGMLGPPLYQEQEFLSLISSWFGNPEILLNLSFTFRTMADVSNKKPRELKINGETVPCKLSGSTFSCTTPKEVKSSYPGQAAWGARNMLFFQLCSTANCPSRCSNLMGLSSHPERSKHALNLEGLFVSGRQQEKLKVHWT